MKKKTVCLMCTAIILLICIAAYFAPLPFLDNVNENCQIGIVAMNYSSHPAYDHLYWDEYRDLTPEQISCFLAVFEKYNYRRTFFTPFSHRYIHESGDRWLTFYMFDGNSQLGSITVTISGQIMLLDGKVYRMENAEQFIEEIVEILEQID